MPAVGECEIANALIDQGSEPTCLYSRHLGHMATSKSHGKHLSDLPVLRPLELEYISKQKADLPGLIGSS